MSVTTGSPGMRGAPTRGMPTATRGRVATSATRGGVTTSRGMMAAARGMMPTSRGAVTPQRGRGRPPGMGASSMPNSGGVRPSNQMAQALDQRGGRGGVTISTVRDGPRPGGPPPLRGAPGMQMRPQQPRGGMTPNQIRPQGGQMDPYYMAAYGGAAKPANNYPPNSMAPGMHQYGNYQMRPQVPQHQQVVQQPQQSPGSSWHTPQGMQNMMPAQSQPQQIDNSFKITIPRKTTPEVIKIDQDGAPVIPATTSVTSSTRPPNIPSNISITPSSGGGSQMSMSSSSSSASTPSSSTPNLVNHNNIPKGISISSSANTSFNTNTHTNANAGPPKPNDNGNGIPDLSSLLEEEDWINSQV